MDGQVNNRNTTDNSIISYISSNSMLHPGDGVVAGISGGADSVCLLTVLSRYRDELAQEKGCDPDEALKIVAVHINHMIRGGEADEDQKFVEELCGNLKVHYISYKKDIPKMAEERHLTEEEAGRIFRYECFEKEADKLENVTRIKIAVAHNKNDLAETVLYNMIRGSSLLGLAGIKPVRGRIIRPLLMTERADIEAFLEENGVSYRTDSTNLVADYARNKIRLKIMPLLREINEGADQHMADIAMDAVRYEESINKEIEKITNLDNSIQDKTDGLHNVDSKEKNIASQNRCEIELSRLAMLSSLARGEFILRCISRICGRRKDITREHVSSVLRLADSESGKRIDLPYNMYAEKVYDRLVIALKNGEKKESLGSIEINQYPYTSEMDIYKKEYTKMIDCDKIKSTLELRTARPEDYIVINSKGDRKKLSRYFTAEKVERNIRSSIPVVADGDEIVWIVGMRLSERYKIGADTREVIEITYLKDDERKA